MHLILTPVYGDAVISLRVEEEAFFVNGKTYSYADLPSEGAVRQDSIGIVIEYGEHGGVSTCRLTDRHEVEVIRPDLPPPPPPEIDIEAQALAELEAQRANWVAQRWQIVTVLGSERWGAIEAFGQGEYATWGLRTVIEFATDIPRKSQTVDLLAYILGLSEDETDEIFRQAISLVA